MDDLSQGIEGEKAADMEDITDHYVGVKKVPTARIR